ncbi:S41 family peptidase [Pseudomarimonas arenosa]|uniref:Tricorn protease homolog n=1 Tax=Pseudomarimonas arenosa TaxID=2774145 RepID=A0AAW3ZK28_9GAMM|nr:S41 family peptidase [Pseudomarimonas arenosa]MBD8525815.1 PD40 domain-containing protein [Pseudomarimonas arenosa]
MVRTTISLALLLGTASFTAAAQTDSPSKLLRFADIHQDRVVFSYAGDLYTAPLAGGTAFRLTSHEGQELYPKFSPDGRQIAFSAEYNGTRQVFVMPAAGGEPTQLTWYNDVGVMPPRGGTDNRVMDWSPDGQCILVRMNRTPWGERNGRPYCVPAAGGLERPLPMPESGGASYSPDGQSLAFTPIDREFRTWKRYRGGRAQDVWTYDLAANTSKQLTDHIGTDQQPMWIGDQVYFVSDRELGTLNLYRVPASGGDASQLTAFSDFDVLWPSAGPGGIVFEKGGSLWHFDPADGQSREIPIRIAADLPETQPRWVDGRDFIDSFSLAPGAERVAIAARGELFTVPVKQGATRNVAHSADAREHSVRWSPDGRWLAYYSDQSGEYELYVRRQDGGGQPRQLTQGGDIWRLNPVWSPDSSRIAISDRLHRLSVVEVSTGTSVQVDVGQYGSPDDYVFSPDSRWLAYAKVNKSNNSSIWLYSIADGKTYQLTGDESRERNPVFDPKGRWLYFLSDRDYNLTFSAFEFNFLYTNATRVYAASLQADGEPFYRNLSDEAGAGGKTEGGAGKSDKAPLRIDLPGFASRVQALKLPPGNYAGLAAGQDGAYVAAVSNGGNGGGAELKYLGRDADEATSYGQITGYELSADGKQILLRRGKDFALIDAKPGQDFDKHKLDLSELKLRVEPRREWQQLYVDAWRILRDVFYDEGMHGQNWLAIRDKYQGLIPHLGSRADLDYVLSEIAGEANAGHVYVESGDQPRVKRVASGLLGAELQPDDSGHVRVGRIFGGENWDQSRRSPLTEPGVSVKEGELILAIDGVSTRGVANVYQLLEGKADQVVELRVAGSPSADSRVERVKPIASEGNLRYLDWVESRRRMVEQASGGRIGYIHLPNTAVDGSREMFRGLLAYASRDALILDDRYNGGGFIPDRMIELLARSPLNYWKSKGLEPYATPLLSHLGPKAMLINGQSSSGGDALPYYFRRLGLGKLFGTRTWGGLIGIQGSNPRLADGGTILAATFRFLDTEGRWDVEDTGVAPDVEVIDRPEAYANDRDPTLEAAVAHLLRELESNPPKRPQTPPAPTTFPRE